MTHQQITLYFALRRAGAAPADAMRTALGA